MNSNGRSRSHMGTPLQQKAAVLSYMDNNRLSSIFQHLLSLLLVEKPTDPRAFMVQELQKMRDSYWSPKVSTRRAFSENDIKKHLPTKPSAIANSSTVPVFVTTLSQRVNSSPLTKSGKLASSDSQLGKGGSSPLTIAKSHKIPSLRPISPKLSTTLSAALSPTSAPPPSPIRETSKITKQHTDDGKTKVNQYILYNNLGSGTYGTVKLGVDSTTGESYAIKVLRKSRLKRIRTLAPGKVEDMLMHVRHEIALMKKLQHENIVKLYEVLDDPTQDKLFMVLEYIKGGPVMQIEEGKTTTPMNPDFVWRYFRDIVKGLDYLHAQKVVHRDIKPENLLVNADGTLKISDFGVSFMFEGEDDTLRKTTGTPAFLAPEICSGSKDLFSGRAVDIWAAGITLYCFVFGVVPFMANTIMQIYEKITTEPLVFLAACDPQLKDLLEKMLQKDPHNRITLQGIKEHPWVTKGGRFELQGQHREEVITEQDLDGAIRQINRIAVLVKAKHFVRVLRGRRASLPEIPRFHCSTPNTESSASPSASLSSPNIPEGLTPESVTQGNNKLIVTPLPLADKTVITRSRAQSTSRVRILYKSKSFDAGKLKGKGVSAPAPLPSPTIPTLLTEKRHRMPIQRASTVLL